MRELDRLNLRGPVRTFRSEFSEWNLAAAERSPPNRQTVIEFRPDGEIQKREEHNPNGSVSRLKNIYDRNGLLLESGFQMDDGPIHRKVCRYDEAGRLTQILEIDVDGTERESQICTYDSEGRKTRVQVVTLPKEFLGTSFCYGVDGAEGSYGAEGVKRITTLYDDRGQPSEALFRNESDAVILRVVLTRDDSRRLVKEECQSGDQSPFSFSQVLDQVAAEQLFGPQKAMYTTLYSYDEAGRRIERLQSMLGASRQRTSWEYDEYDNPIREVTETKSSDLSSDDSGNMQSVNPKSFTNELRFDYKYDSRGNWTERVVSFRATTEDFQTSSIERREILYYA